MRRWAALIGWAMIAAPAFAQTTPLPAPAPLPSTAVSSNSPQSDAAPSDAYRQRADQLATILRSDGGEDSFFSPIFTNAVPVDQWRGITRSLRTQYGDVQNVERIVPENATSAIVDIGFARAIVSISLVIAPDAPHAVIGLRILGARMREDSAEKLVADIAALPGRGAIGVARLNADGPHMLFGTAATQVQAVGSSYKLYILAELVRAVKAGERRWSDVIPLDAKSFSGRLASWPDRAPMTLHSLAVAMIAESDNSASDTLLRALGRARVDAMVAATGHADAARTLPILSTVEAFALKQPGAQDLRWLYAGATVTGRRSLLIREAARLGRNRVDIAQVADRPVAIDSIEWFAAPADMIRLLDWLRRQGGDALPILSVNPGIGAGDAARWASLGYKGGSEPGVIAMNFLACAKDRQCYAVAGSWNDPNATVDNDRFVALMTRALNLIAATKP